MSKPVTYENIIHEERFNMLDRRFGHFMQALDGRNETAVFLAAAAVSSAGRHGHICLELSQEAGKPISMNADQHFPDLNNWIEILTSSPVVGAPGEFKPMIFDGTSKLYLHRYAVYQERLIAAIQSRICSRTPLPIQESKETVANLLGPYRETDPMDWQKIACILSLHRKFSVISGGPGTGKTTTIVKLIALHLETNPVRPFKIALTVPTGKAAARLQDAIRQAKKQLDCRNEVRECIPSTVFTIHRLLGTIPGTSDFRHHASNPLDLDLLIVDESSMVDLALLSRLTQALPPHAHLILVGDKDQLASVEAGSAFGDICDACRINTFSEDFTRRVVETTGIPLPSNCKEEGGKGIVDCLIQLQTNYRFGQDSGIRRLSEAVQAGNGESAMNLLRQPDFKDIDWEAIPSPGKLFQRLLLPVRNGFRSYLTADHPSEVIRAFNQFRILCALREGPYGVQMVNQWIEDMLRSEGLIGQGGSNWYHGRPVMITRNDYDMGLFNGDVGITLEDPEDRALRVFFPDEVAGFRKVHPTRIGEHETVYAMTVHKSQGSEFETVLLLLPDRDNPILTRELVYTGITRSRKKVSVWGSEPVFKRAVGKRVTRISGLTKALVIQNPPELPE